MESKVSNRNKDLEIQIVEILKNNKIKDVEEGFAFILKIVNNIKHEPLTQKVFVFNKNDSEYKSKIFNLNGGAKLLETLGFVTSSNNNDEMSIDIVNNKENKASVEHLEELVKKTITMLEKSHKKVEVIKHSESNEQSFPVTLYIYDLTNGMAKTFSPMLIGKVVEGVWHTSICVFNSEYFFGGGICKDAPKKTPYGLPVKELPLGETFITKNIFEDYLKDINKQYSPETYNFLNNNCNHFTNDIAQFLTGNEIPKEITNQHEVLLGTPMGNMLLPMLQNMGVSTVPAMFEEKK